MEENDGRFVSEDGDSFSSSFAWQHGQPFFYKKKEYAVQVISLGDKIKFSLSPSKSKDRLSTNVPGIPLDERYLIIKALNLYRKKTGSDKFFWKEVESHDELWSTALKKIKEASPLSLKITLQSVSGLIIFTIRECSNKQVQCCN
ncbi:hypothetical protein L1887_11567 [Cichorium endivia]|nr:hypothetical protein L1887_11567 [Cichorium endivia]